VIRKYYWLLFVLPLVPIAVLALYLFPEDKPLLASEYFSWGDRPLVTNGSAWKTSDNIQQPPPKVLADLTGGGWNVLTEKIDELWWIARLTGERAGRLESPAFVAPRWISLTVSGDLTRPDNELYFLREGGNERVSVRVRTEERFWRRVTYALPSDWVGKRIRLVAEAGPRDLANWFGFTNPRALGTGTVLAKQLRTLCFLPVFVVALFLFLLPGLVPAAWLAHRSVVNPRLALPLAIMFSCLAGYLCFWIYLYNADFGRWFALAVLAGSAGLLFVSLKARGAVRTILASCVVLKPLALMALTGLFYLAVLYSVDLEVGVEGQPRMRFFEFTLAVDNEIPYFFAQPLFNGQAVLESFQKKVPGWHTSDRPPLQTGLILLQLPVARLFVSEELGRLYALVVGIALQCAWVPAVWSLWAASLLSPGRAASALLLVLLSGFALVNTSFAWPKMLSAALVVFATTIGIVDGVPGSRSLSIGRAVLLGLAAALATLGHGGAVFTLLPLGLLFLLPRWYPGFARLVVAAAAYLGLLFPWMYYQRQFDPPGTRLLKLHLAGDSGAGDSDTWRDARPAWQNVVAAYRAKSAAEIASNKLLNLKTLFVPAPDQYSWPPKETPATWPHDATGFRRCDFLALFWTLGILNLGWVAAIVQFVRGTLKVSWDLSVTVPAIALASLLVWAVLMFGPGSTVVHQGPYGTFLLLFAALAAWLVTSWRWLTPLLLVLQATVFTWGWLLTSPANSFGPVNPFMNVAAVLLFAAICRVAYSAEQELAVKGPIPEPST
jgi:hypothetical protein